MIENMNKLLEQNDIMCRIGSTWYKLEEIGISPSGRMDIAVSDEDGEEFIHFDMSDIDEIDPIFDLLQDVNSQSIVGVA